MSKFQKFKKPLIITAIVLGALVLGAVIVGILNATVAGGSWSFGWSDYRYDESGYEIGSGTVEAPEVTSIDVDWIDGSVQVVLCDDMYLSLTETSKQALTNDSLLRWCVSEDGKALTVKYRKSSWFFGSSENKNKNLILRVPRRLMKSLESLTVNAVSANVTVTDVEVKQMNLKSLSGEIAVTCKVSPNKLNVEATSGNVKLVLPRDTGFLLEHVTDTGKIILDFQHTKENGRYVYRVPNASDADIKVKAAKGDVTVTYEN